MALQTKDGVDEPGDCMMAGPVPCVLHRDFVRRLNDDLIMQPLRSKRSPAFYAEVTAKDGHNGNSQSLLLQKQGPSPPVVRLDQT